VYPLAGQPPGGLEEQATMRDYAKGIGERLRALRQERKLTQEQLSERADYDATYIGMVERGERVPSLKFLLAVADALEVPAGALLADALPQSDLQTENLLLHELLQLARGQDPDRVRLVIELARVVFRHSDA
jgi:transcriptional regulator with XRE-family HTH domain